MKIRVRKALLKGRSSNNSSTNKRNISLDLDKKDIQLLYKPINFNKLKNYNQYRNQKITNTNKKFVLKSISPKNTIVSTPKALKSNIFFYNRLKDTSRIEKEMNEPKSSEGTVSSIYSTENNNFNYYRKINNNKSNNINNNNRISNNNSNIIYKKKSIAKNKKINVHVHKKNFSMNYYININTNLKNHNLLNSPKLKINKDYFKTKIKIRPDLGSKK